MSPSLLRRRFGHGAARLPLAAPHADGLARQADSPVAHEELVGFAPIVLVLLLATLLVSAVLYETRLESSLETPVRIQLWTERAAPPVLPEPVVSQPERVVEAPIPARAAPAAPTPDLAIAPTESSAPLPASLPMPKLEALAAPLGRVAASSPILHSNTATKSSKPRPTARSSVDELSLGVGMAAVARPGNPDESESALAFGGARQGTLARPESDSQGVPDGAREWSRSTSREAFLARESDATAGTNAVAPVPAALRGRRAPAVAAARPEGLIRDSLTDSRSQGQRGVAAGWEEVPLDALPDCSPPGRQDQLKQQILRSAATRPVCANANGRYRFVETRNLGAFLMWIEAVPTRPFIADDARDACQILEAALLCLQDGPSNSILSSNEESENR